MKWMRATSELTFLDYVDLLSRGSTEEWQELYAEARQNPQVRVLIGKAIEYVDPDLGEAGVLWRFLLDTMSSADAVLPSEAVPRSAIREKLRRIAGVRCAPSAEQRATPGAGIRSPWRDADDTPPSDL